MSVYLDYNASGLVRPEVREAMAEALADGGNPNAVHAAGRRARARVENARAKVADLVGADPTAIVFSSANGDGHTDLVARDRTGKMWVLPATTGTTFKTRMRIGFAKGYNLFG